MPVFHAMARRANTTLTAEGLAGVDSALFAEGRSLVEALQELGVIVNDEEASYIAAFPSGLQEAVRALVHDNIASGAPLDMTFAWAPGYEDELSLWQVADGDHTTGGITVFIRSRFPEDRTAAGRGLKG
jgi:hypothetical protein